MITHPLDLNAISDKWLTQCGPHDYGVTSAGCNCPDGDPRPVIARLVAEVERLRRDYGTALGLLSELTDEDDCWFDHHGGCQAHGYLSLKSGETCPHRDAKDLIASGSPKDGGDR